MLIDRIIRDGNNRIVLTDASRAVHILCQRFQNNLSEAFHLSRHGKDLIQIGHGDDLLYCAQIDMTDVVPLFKGGVIQ